MKLSLPVLAMISLIGLPSLANSQQIQIAPAIAVGGQQIDVEAIMKEQLEKQKVTWQQDMKVLVADIDSICRLTAEQKSKLEVAAKGAIEKSITQLKQQQGQMGMAMPLQAVAGGLPDVGGGEVRGEKAKPQDAKEAEEKSQKAGENKADDDKADVQQAANTIEIQALPAGQAGVAVRMGGAMGGWMNASTDGSSPAQQEIWKKTVKMTLSEPQATSYEQFAKSRADRAREANVSAFVAKVDVKLLLNETQSNQLRELITTHYGDVAFENVAGFGGIAFFGGDEAIDNGPFVKSLAGVLSETQLEIWKENFQSGLDFAKMANGVRVQRVMPAMPLRPAAPAAPVAPGKRD